MKILKKPKYAFGGPTPLEASKAKTGIDALLGSAAGMSKTGGSISAYGDLASSLFNTESQSGSVAGSALKYGAKGAEIGSMAGPYGTAIGAGVGAIGGAIVGDINYEQAQKAKEEEKKRAYNASTERGVNNFRAMSASGFPISGVGAVPMYAFGGMINDTEAQYKAEGGEVVTHSPGNAPMVNPEQGSADPLSSTTTKLEGDSHSNASGGISAAQGDFVFSDRIPVDKSIKENLKDNFGISVSKINTFADAATALGKIEAEAERKSISTNTAEANTGKLTLEKTKAIKATLMEVQESVAASMQEEQEVAEPMQENGMPAFGLGGPIKPVVKNTADNTRQPTATRRDPNLPFDTEAKRNAELIKQRNDKAIDKADTEKAAFAMLLRGAGKEIAEFPNLILGLGKLATQYTGEEYFDPAGLSTKTPNAVNKAKTFIDNVTTVKGKEAYQNTPAAKAAESFGAYIPDIAQVLMSGGTSAMAKKAIKESAKNVVGDQVKAVGATPAFAYGGPVGSEFLRREPNMLNTGLGTPQKSVNFNSPYLPASQQPYDVTVPTINNGTPLANVNLPQIANATNPVNPFTDKNMRASVPITETGYAKPFNPLADYMPTKMAPFAGQIPGNPDYVAPVGNNFPTTAEINAGITKVGKGINKGMNALNKNLPGAFSAANFAVNRKLIGDLPLEQEQYPTRNFVGMDATDRSGEARFNANSSFNAALSAMRGANASANNANIQNLLATNLKGINSINTQELARQDNIRANNLGRFDQVDNFNVNQENTRYGDRQTNAAVRIGETMKNNNALIQSIIGQREQADLKQISQLNTKLIAAKYTSGVAARSAPAAEVLELAGYSKEEIKALDTASKEALKKKTLDAAFPI
jgi:hypothetical protein